MIKFITTFFILIIVAIYFQIKSYNNNIHLNTVRDKHIKNYTLENKFSFLSRHPYYDIYIRGHFTEHGLHYSVLNERLGSIFLENITLCGSTFKIHKSIPAFQIEKKANKYFLKSKCNKASEITFKFKNVESRYIFTNILHVNAGRIKVSNDNEDDNFFLTLSEKATLENKTIDCKGQPGGLYVQRGSDVKIRNVTIKNCNGGFYHSEYLHGALTIFASKIDIKGLTIINSKAEDSLHISYSKGLIKEINVLRSSSDAIDINKSKLKMESIKITDSKGDGIDLYNSSIEAINIIISNSADKAISIGEVSSLSLTHAKLTNNTIGISLKDYSQLIKKNISYDKNKTDINQYNNNIFNEDK